MQAPAAAKGAEWSGRGDASSADGGNLEEAVARARAQYAQTREEVVWDTDADGQEDV